MPAFCTILALLGPLAVPMPAPLPAPMSVTPRLRPADVTAARAFDRALACCPTIRALVRDVEASDLIVYVETGFVQQPAMARTVLMGAGTNIRYVRLTLHRLTSPDNLIELLGHELQHAVEIAQAPEVRDSDTMLGLYKRIGFHRRTATHFETIAARQIATRVRAEVAKRPSLAAFTAVEDVDSSRQKR
jgi:hypothetical protein